MTIRTLKICSMGLALALAAVSGSALADIGERRFIQTLHPEIEELPPPQAGLGFGNAVVVQDDLALVGHGFETGRIAVFAREDRLWRRAGTLQCPLPLCGPITLRDDLAVVHGYDLNSGIQTLSIFRHEQGTWTLTDSIGKPLPGVPDLWVRAVRYRDGIVAATVGPTFPPEPAEVYLYELDADAKVQRTLRLAPSDPDLRHNFGSDIAMGDNIIAVGDAAWSSGASGPPTGAVYIFERRGGTWLQTQILTAADGIADDQFGRHLAMDGNLLLISAPRATRRGSARPTGAVYAFERTNGTWIQRAKLAPSTKTFGAYSDFGSSMVLSGGRAVITATAPAESSDRGLAFEYRLSQQRFAPVSFIRSFNPPALALEGSRLLVGSTWDSPESPIGHAAVYDLSSPLPRKQFCTPGKDSFCDDFENGSAEKWQPIGGSWTVESREYVGRAGTDVCNTGFSSNETLIRHLDAADVDVRLEMRAIQRVDKGVILRSTSAGDQIELNFRASPFFSDLVVQELVGCQFTFLEAVSVPHEMGEVLQVRIRLAGRRLTVWVKERVVLDRSLPFQAKRGGVGLAVITDHGVSAFDNVRVKVLRHPR